MGGAVNKRKESCGGLLRNISCDENSEELLQHEVPKLLEGIPKQFSW